MPTSLQPLHQPQLPQGLREIERLGHDAADEALELPDGAGPRQRRVPHVVVQVETVVVDPHGVVFDGDEREPLAMTRDRIEATLDAGADARHIDAAALGRQRTRFDDAHLADVHVGVAGLHEDHRRIERRQPFVMRARHGRLSLGAQRTGIGVSLLRFGGHRRYGALVSAV